MTVLELKTRLADFPDDMQVVRYIDFRPDLDDLYGETVEEIKTARPRLSKEILGMKMIQGRPVKDDEACLVLVIK